MNLVSFCTCALEATKMAKPMPVKTWIVRVNILNSCFEFEEILNEFNSLFNELRTLVYFTCNLVRTLLYQDFENMSWKPFGESQEQMRWVT